MAGNTAPKCHVCSFDSEKLGFFPTVSVRQHEIIILAFYIAADYMKDNRDAFDQAISQIVARKAAQFLSNLPLAVVLAMSIKRLKVFIWAIRKQNQPSKCSIIN